MTGPGSHLKKMFGSMLANAGPHCLCRPRAQLMDVWGIRLCKLNIEAIVDWVEEEADKQNLIENQTVIDKATAFAVRHMGIKYLILRPFPRVRLWIARRILGQPGKGRRLIIKRMVLICIERARRGKTP
jgi:hypothetical protein